MCWQDKRGLFLNKSISPLSLTWGETSWTCMTSAQPRKCNFNMEGVKEGSTGNHFLTVQASIRWCDTRACPKVCGSWQRNQTQKLEMSRGRSAVSPCRQCYTPLTLPSLSHTRTHPQSQVDARHTQAPPPAKSLLACWCVQRSSEQVPA